MPVKKKPRPSRAKPKGERAKQIELTQRTAKVAELLMQGLGVPQIRQYVTEKLHWKTSERSLYRYVQKANEEFTKEAQTKHTQEFGKALRRLNFLFANCLKIQDYKAALAMQREINEMMGFRNKYEVKETIVQEDLDTSKLTPEEKEKMAEISRKLRVT